MVAGPRNRTMNIRGLATLLFLVVFSASACAKPAPKSIDELRNTHRNVSLKSLGEIKGGRGFQTELYQYESAGLNVHAIIARPNTPAPDGGYPLLIANHGHHPEPQKHGKSADGEDWRPGDYYRRIPEVFTALGYAVVMPDYRGHSNSEGFEFTVGMLESAYYPEDVLNLIDGLADIADVNQDEFFMWGHSMGGQVTLRTLLATDRIKAASVWSSTGGDIWDRAYYYSRYENPSAPDNSNKEKHRVTGLREHIAGLDGDFDWASVEPLHYVQYLETPVIIHHAIEDRSAAYKWSEQLAKTLYMAGMAYEFWSYEGSDHLFAGDELELAAQRDHAFFRSRP